MEMVFMTWKLGMERWGRCLFLVQVVVFGARGRWVFEGRGGKVRSLERARTNVVGGCDFVVMKVPPVASFN